MLSNVDLEWFPVDSPDLEARIDPSSYSALIFDCDGTPANTLPEFRAWQIALGASGISDRQILGKP